MPDFGKDALGRQMTVQQWWNKRLEGLKRRLGYDYQSLSVSLINERIPLDVTAADIPFTPEYCPVLPGIKLNYADHGKKKRGQSENRPEIDRIDPNKGYVKGNIRVISMRANRLKNDATSDELYYLWQDALSRGAKEPVF